MTTEQFTQGAGLVGGRSSAIIRRISAKRFCDWRLRYLNRDIAAMAHDLRADLDQFLFQARQRPPRSLAQRPMLYGGATPPLTGQCPAIHHMKVTERAKIIPRRA